MIFSLIKDFLIYSLTYRIFLQKASVKFGVSSVYYRFLHIFIYIFTIRQLFFDGFFVLFDLQF